MMMKASLLEVLGTYLFSQLIARQVFRNVYPNERLVHVPLEETAKTAAHLLLLIFSVFLLFIFKNNFFQRKYED
jgi:hypothetical protein